jgi:hypothetical protein
MAEALLHDHIDEDDGIIITTITIRQIIKVVVPPVIVHPTMTVLCLI